MRLQAGLQAEAEAASTGFLVELPVFSGSLAELAGALRTGKLRPAEVPLLALTREVLDWVSRTTHAGWAQTHPELLPALATVIALKARLLLPQPEPDDPYDDFYEADLGVDEVAQGVEALAELGTLVAFLSARREERATLLPAPAVPVDLPRRERKRNASGSLAKLVRAAKNAVREVEVPLLARERLSLADALSHLRAYAARLTHFTFRGIHAADWGEETTYFAALLEGVKEGSFAVQQDENYGDIRIEAQGQRER